MMKKPEMPAEPPASPDTPPVDPPPETNVLIAIAVLIHCVVLDALTALPVADAANVPTSLRTSGMTLVAIIAANPVISSHAYEQRGAAALLLAAVSFAGSHHAEATIRVSDAVFVLITGLASAAFFARGGLEHVDRLVACFRRSSAVNLSAALLFYAGCRLFRAAVTIPGEVQAFSVGVSDEEFQALGYAYASAVSALSIGFCGAAAAATAVLIFLSNSRVIELGCEAVSHATSLIAGMVFVASLIATFEQFVSSTQLPAIFGPNACTGMVEQCVASYRARRFNAASLACANCWSIALALTVFSFPEGVRFKTRREAFEWLPDVSWTVAGGVMTLLSLLVVWSYNADVASDFSEYVLAVSIAAAFVSGFFSSILGGLLQIGAMAALLLLRVDQSEIDVFVQFLTNLSFIATLGLTVAFTLTSIGSYALWFWRRQEAPVLEFFTGMLLVAALSIQLGLFTATAGLMASYDGSMLVGDAQVTDQACHWIATHFAPFFFLAATLAVRVEPSMLSRRMFWVAWAVPVVAVGVIWAVTLAVSTSGSPYGRVADPGSLAIGTVAGLVPWVLTAVLTPL